MKPIDLSALAAVTGGGLFSRSTRVVATNGGVAIGGDVTGSTITVGPNSPGISIQGDLKGVNIINGKIVPPTR